jgi:hypothetical protein
MWSADETMTGNYATKACVHDSVNLLTGCAPQLLRIAEKSEKSVEKQQVYVKSGSCSLWMSV